MYKFSPSEPREIEKYLLEGELSFSARERVLWDYQYQFNPFIQQFCKELNRSGPLSMPISFFKHLDMKCGDWTAETIFQSSGTTGQQASQHHVRNLKLYEQNSLTGFHAFFDQQAYRILALLPSYLERGQSSLVYMVKTWIESFGLPGSGFYLYNVDALRQSLLEAMDAGERILLIGVAYALLDFVESHALPLAPNSIVMETGGMKGRKKEITRELLHARLRDGFGLDHIYSEYGMTEMMSQAYTQANGRFYPSPTLRAYVSDIHLDRLLQPTAVAGRLHLVDLANVHSCAFIATDDLGRMYEDGSFEVLGRIDSAELRGCSLMYV